MNPLGMNPLAVLAAAGFASSRGNTTVAREPANPPEYVVAAQLRAESKKANREYVARWLERKKR